MGKLSGKTALVTGGSAGIGLGIAKRLAEDGAQVIIVGRRQAVIDEALPHIGNGAIGVTGDVTVSADLDRVFAAVAARFGGLDALVLNAGGVGGGPLESCTEEAFDTLFALNTRSVFFATQKALPLLRNPSNVVLIGSVADQIVVPGGSVYAASKAAVKAFARCWAEDLAPRGIRVHLLGPGYTETPLFDRITATDAGRERFDEWTLNRTSLKRRGRPEEIGAVAAFLCSDDSSYMTGGAIYVGGGAENW
jgi:NAD(P)-dependent dehydrogenase (short-subunit alcohol dehydrogenase family)